jgi:replicative DNA helicase
MSIEKQVLGSLIANPDKFVEVSEIISENSFIDEDAKNVFAVFKKTLRIGEQDKPCSSSTEGQSNGTTL